MSLKFSFISDPGQLPPPLGDRKLGGVLLYGEPPSTELQNRLQALPTVWLMAGAHRPQWGDQVLPDNTAIGELAAEYLLRRGHRRLGYLGVGSRLWGMEVRSRSFARAALDGGGRVDVFQSNETLADAWHGQALRETVERLVQRFLSLAERPTGLFVSDSRLLPAINVALADRNLTVGPGADVDLVSCNSEQRQVMPVVIPAAEIDIRVESIGRRGVEQLLWRLANPRAAERIRAMVEPILIHSANQNGR